MRAHRALGRGERLDQALLRGERPREGAPDLADLLPEQEDPQGYPGRAGGGLDDATGMGAAGGGAACGGAACEGAAIGSSISVPSGSLTRKTSP